MAYGFVRFVTKASALLAISQMDGYWAGRSNLAVKEAIYNKWSGKNHSRPHTAVRPLFTLTGQKEDPFLLAKDRTISHTGLGGTKGHSHNHRSYAQVTAGVAMEDIGGDVPVKKLIVYGQPSSTDWLNNCVIAKCPSNPGVIISSDMLSNSFKGLKKTMYWGGRKVLMEFCSKKDLDEAVAESEWKSVFVEFYPWNGEMVNLERLVWIECAHLPISVWNQNTFSEIAGLWGSLVAVNDDTLNQRDLSSAKLLIETEAQVIGGSFEVSVDGSLFVVDVREVAGVSDSQPLRSGRSIVGPESRVPEVQKVRTELTSLNDIVLRNSPASIRPEVAVTKSGNPEPSASSGMLSDFLDEEEDRVDMLSLKETILCNQIITKGATGAGGILSSDLHMDILGCKEGSATTSHPEVLLPPIGCVVPSDALEYCTPLVGVGFDINGSSTNEGILPCNDVVQADKVAYCGSPDVPVHNLGSTEVCAVECQFGEGCHVSVPVVQQVVDSFGSDSSSSTEGLATGADSYQNREIVRTVFGLDDLIIKSGANKAVLSKDDPSIVILDHTKAVKTRVSQNPAKKDSKGKQSLSYGGSIKAGFFKKSLSLSSKSSKSDKKSEKVKQCLVPEYKFPSMAEEIAGTRDMSKALGLSLDGVTDEQIRDRIIQKKSLG